MIYLSLLKRRISNSERHSRREMLSTEGKAAAMAKIHFFEKRARSLSNDSQRSKSADSASGVGDKRRQSSPSYGGRSSSANSDAKQARNRSRSLYEQVTGDGNETSDWSSTGSLFSGREKSSPKLSDSPMHGSQGDELLTQTISERVQEHLPEFSSDNDRDAEKEMESQMISEKETDTLSDFSSGSLVRDKPPPHDQTSLVQIPQQKPLSQHRNQEHVLQIQSPSRNGASSVGDSAASINVSSESSNRENQSFGNGSRGRDSPKGSNGVPDGYRGHSSPTHSSRSVEQSGVTNGAGRSSPSGDHSLQRTSDENRSIHAPREESLRIRIKRPKDYIRQWEDTMDRLSGTPPASDVSPRTPLISKYARSKSFESGGSPVTLRASQAREYSSALRSRSNELAPKITVTSDAHGRRARAQEVLNKSTRSSTSVTSTSVGSTLVSPASTVSSENQSLQSILERLPEHMRQQAKNASKFLMHSSGPEVIALIDAIKDARESTGTRRPRNGVASEEEGEGTTLKRVHQSEASPSTARVRFQPAGTTRSQEMRGLASESVRPSALRSSTTSPVPSRVGSLTSPQRRAISSSGVSGNGDGERGSDRMLSISPRDRSRSLSPTALGSDSRSSTLNPKSPRGTALSDGESTSPSRAMREELLLKNLGLNTRVVEDERPSSRLKALSASPRLNDTDSPGRMYTSSPRKPQTAYPEVTRLELGLDSDRSYVSHTEDGSESPPPVRRGGAGRVPRREAWEQQRKRKEEATLAATFTSSKSDSVAQSKFIEVLCKEIEVLKQKVEMMEEEEFKRSRSRSGASPRVSGKFRLNDSIRNENNEMILAPRVALSVSPRADRSISCPLLQTSSRSALLRSPRAASSVTRADSTSVKRPMASYSSATHSRSSSIPGSAGNITHTRAESPQRQGGIRLGYTSPARSVTPEIWGNDLTTASGLDPEKQENWKLLISSRNLSEAEVIELKQALACAVVEHDILTAKLNNARHEIHDKLRHTNEVLDDCRHHLAKSQAENMELRTKLEQERQRSEGFENRIKEMESNMSEIRADNQTLEDELSQTSSMLDKSVHETKPGVDALKAENTTLISRLAHVENENDSLVEQVQNLKRTQAKTMNTVDELRDCLHKVRRERQELFDELSVIQQREQSSRVRDILNSYQEKGARDEREHERNIRERQSRSLSTSYSVRDSSVFSDLDDTAVRSTHPVHDTSFSSYSPRQVTPRRSSSQQRYLAYDDLSPSSYREIYPHRKSYQPRSRSVSPRARKMYSPTCYLSTSNLDDSVVDQTLQEIEQDMARDRQAFLRNNTPLARRRLKLSSYPSDEDLQIGSRSRSSYGQGRGSSHQASPDRGGSGCESDVAHRSRSLSYGKDLVGKSTHSARESDYLLPHSFASSDDAWRKRSSSSSPSRFSPRPGILKSREPLRSRSPSSSRLGVGDYAGDRTSILSTLGSVTPERSRSPVYFPRESHSPPTRLSPDHTKEKASTPVARRPMHQKSGAGAIARNLQKEFDKEDKILNALSKSTVFQNKSWFEMQSDSDGDDTGINSSMSSRSSIERTGTARKKTPLLTEQQRRYADELIEKYTGNTPL
ncbi:serine/arginine repetitive matrix protein 2 [Aplysia californica]|uniref:Serine/arginine repetitive matrix protein 2 n=1 Tax=Aplysia californica TaxID=6500 RepID=A0ABM0JRJ7_APLCA|nr:serine/arginine repetitive matrix protein 2 [Aplysia californica]